MAKFRALKIKDRGEVEKLLFELSDKKVNLKISQFIGNKKCICKVVELENKIVGFGCLTIYLTPGSGEVGKIEDIIINAEFREKGYGLTLVKELITEAKKAKLKKISLTSNPQRVAARKLYKKLGFEKIATEVFVLNLK